MEDEQNSAFIYTSKVMNPVYSYHIDVQMTTIPIL